MALFRGVEEVQEVSSSRLYRDTTPAGKRIFRWMVSIEGTVTILCSNAFLGIILPNVMEWSIPLNLGILYLHFKSPYRLPIRYPIWSGVKDPSDLHPAHKKPQLASGIHFLGIERTKEHRQVFLAKKDVCTHTLMFATTGSGKTEALLSMLTNSMVQGSGCTYVDGKADSSLLTKVYAITKQFGREEDLLVINYNTGGVDISFKTPDQRMSNNTNPLMFGNSGTVTELLVSLMSNSDGKGDFWKDRAISLVQSVVPALVWLRDERGLLLDVSVVREYLNLSRIIELRKIKEMPQNLQDSLRAYCENLAGWSESKGVKQSDTTNEQHGFLQMQFTRVLGSLGDVYGHIFKTQLGEVDMRDVVVNRRILLVLIPSLEKSPAELQNLGKIIVALIKSMMAAALGNRFEGTIQEIVDDRFTNADTPYQVIFDEYGMYSVDGAAVMPAQARSLNMSMVFTGQDYQAFAKSGKDNADSIIANCNVKMFGKIEDHGDTWRIAEGAADKAYVTNTVSYDRTNNGLDGYVPDTSVRVENVARINYLDLKDQMDGQFHVFFSAQMMRIESFFANPPQPKQQLIRLPHLVPVRAPSIDVLNQVNESMLTLKNRLKDPSFHEEMPDPVVTSDLMVLMKGMRLHNHLPAHDRAAATIAYYHNENVGTVLKSPAPPDADQMEDITESLFNHHIDVFTAPPSELLLATSQNLEDAMVREQIARQDQLNNLIASTLGEGNMHLDKAMLAGLLDESDVREGVERIEATVGASPGEAARRAGEITDAMQQATSYPEQPPPKLDNDDEYLAMMDTLSSIILEDMQPDGESNG